MPCSAVLRLRSSRAELPQGLELAVCLDMRALRGGGVKLAALLSSREEKVGLMAATLPLQLGNSLLQDCFIGFYRRTFYFLAVLLLS